jgi:FkbM family methyltransferase
MDIDYMVKSYSIEYLRLSEDKKVLYFKIASSKSQKVLYKVYNTYLGFVQFHGSMDLEPNVEYYISLPYTSKNRYVVFSDYHTLATVGMFGLDGNYDYDKIDKNNYIKNISKDFTIQQKWDTDYIISEIFRDRVYNNDFVSVESGDVVFDVGFNYGFFSLDALQFNPNRIIAFEPNLNLCKKYNHYLNHPKIELHQVGLSDKNETVTFYENEYSGRGTTISDINQTDVASSFDVELVSINEFIKNNSIDRIDYLKIDCEGGEYAIFDSIDKTFLKEKVKKVALEFHHPLNDKKVVKLLNILKECGGFNVRILYEDGGSTGMIYAKK